jgi:NitT/TauT family transport system permease protein
MINSIVAIRFGIVALLLVAWFVVVTIYPAMTFYISTPIDVCASLYTMISEEGYVVDVATTAAEAGTGIVLGFTTGVVIGLVLWMNRTLGRALEPVLVALAAIPVLALAPLAIIWLGVGMQMKVVLAALGVFFVAVRATYDGARNSYEQYASGLMIKPSPRPSIVTKVVLPGAFAWVLGGMRTSVGVGLLGAFIGEFITSERGLGHLILRSTGLYNMSRAISAAFGIVLLAVVFDYLGALIETHRRWIVQAISVPRDIWTKRVAPRLDTRVL